MKLAIKVGGKIPLSVAALYALAIVSSLLCALTILLLLQQGAIEHSAHIPTGKSLLTADQYGLLSALILPATMACSLVSTTISLLHIKRRRAARLAQLVENARSLAAGRKPQPLSGQDELAELQRIFTKMYASISRLRQSERAILDHAAEGICSLDEGMRLANVNHAFAAMFGRCADELRGSRLAAYLSAEALERTKQALEKARDELDAVRFQIEVVGKDGSSTLSWALVFDPEQQEYYCLVQDITKQARLEKLKSEFTAMVSHDLRTPLASIELALGLLSSENISTESQETLTIAQGSVRRLLALVNNLLDLDKLEADSMAIFREQKCLRPLVESCTAALAMLAAQKKLRVEVDIPENLVAYVDEERISQVLINILANAYKFSPRGQAITITACNQNSHILVEIQDHGPGIPEDMLEAIFERFKQVKRSDKIGGTGLGLAISRAIVEKHGGTIGVRSQLEKGSIFWFTLPAQTVKH